MADKDDNKKQIDSPSTFFTMDNNSEMPLERDNADELQPSPKRQKLESSIALSTSFGSDVGCPDDLDSEECRNYSKEDIVKLEKTVKEKIEKLETLKLVERYRIKWTKEELQGLIDDWKEVAVSSFEDLYEKSKLEKTDLTKEGFLEYLGVEAKLLDLE